MLWKPLLTFLLALSHQNRFARNAQHVALSATKPIALLQSSRYSSSRRMQIATFRSLGKHQANQPGAQTRCPARSSTPPLQPRLLSSTHTRHPLTAPP
ncbi:hypothetical protein BKA63DRAFT_48857 [Paraphoma chrysanthemicola]|nr:hypothetical protein BKA63DRAFT_48857 [Paraphoma chrysanthemicola]